MYFYTKILMNSYGDGKHSIEILFDGQEGRISLYILFILLLFNSFVDEAFSKHDNDVIAHIYEYCLQCQ